MKNSRKISVVYEVPLGSYCNWEIPEGCGMTTFELCPLKRSSPRNECIAFNRVLDEAQATVGDEVCVRSLKCEECINADEVRGSGVLVSYGSCSHMSGGHSIDTPDKDLEH